MSTPNHTNVESWKSVVAITLGALVVVPALVSAYRTPERIRATQADAERIDPVVALVLCVFTGPFAAAYYQCT